MLRDKNLIPLSHQHQHALALCVRIDRAKPIPEKDLHSWQAEIEEYFEHEIKVHFAAEEAEVFPAARRFSELTSPVEELLADHVSLREWFSEAEARRLSPENLPVFAGALSAHIRKIEEYFEHEIKVHFAAEEAEVFPAARRFSELTSLVEELLADHVSLREWFSEAEARRLSPENLPVFAGALSAHIRKEERQLFERLQELLTSEELEVLGKRLEKALAEAQQTCILPSEATKLKAKR